MTELPFKFDEIGYWSELKLEIVEKYGAAYTTTFAKVPNLTKLLHRRIQRRRRPRLEENQGPDRWKPVARVESHGVASCSVQTISYLMPSGSLKNTA